MDYQTSVHNHQMNGYKYDCLRNPESRVLKWGATCVCCFSVFLIRVLTTKRREWRTTKGQWTTTKRMVTITIVYAIWKAEFWTRGGRLPNE